MSIKVMEEGQTGKFLGKETPGNSPRRSGIYEQSKLVVFVKPKQSGIFNCFGFTKITSASQILNCILSNALYFSTNCVRKSNIINFTFSNFSFLNNPIIS